MSSDTARRLEEECPRSVDHSKPSQSLDIPALMAQIRERVTKESEGKTIRRSFQPTAAHLDRAGNWRAGAIQHSEELRYLNTHWQYSSAFNIDGISSHRGGIVGKIIVKAKRWLLRIVWDTLLKPVHEEERAYQMRLVQFLNNFSKYVDDRDGSNFWEIIRKVDADVATISTRLDRNLDEQSATTRSVERTLTDGLNTSMRQLSEKVEQLAAQVAQRDSRLATVESVSAGLEGVTARISKALTALQGGSTPSSEVPPQTQQTPVGDVSYLLLENRFRGSEALIRERMQHYVELFKKASAPVLDLGAGRGELLKLLKESEISAYGVDPDAAMISVAHENGLDVRLGDGLAHLNELPSRSLGGIIATQVVEHLTHQQITALLNLCREKVVPGGKVVFETINPRSLVALSSNYFRDPSHVFPVHPDTLSYAMTLAGIKVIDIRYLSPIPKDAQLSELAVDDHMTPRWAHAVTLLNQNTRQLNELLYGHQDYCVVGEVLEAQGA